VESFILSKQDYSAATLSQIYFWKLEFFGSLADVFFSPVDIFGRPVDIFGSPAATFVSAQ